MFIFSTCAVREEEHPRDSLYMWSHYGNGHRGVAIEFDTKALAESFIKEDDPDSKHPWWEMKYSNEIPKVKREDIFEYAMNKHLNSNGSLLKLSSVVTERTRYKGKIWENEQEWRLVWSDETKLKIVRHDITSNAVTAVYLGCRAAEQEMVRKNFIYETQRNFPNATVFRANKRPGEFALDFEKIS